jgi:copper chaperone CopZ
MVRAIALAVALLIVSDARADEVKVITVKGAKCSMCVDTITGALKAVTGVKTAKVDLKKKTATVTFDPEVVTLPELEKAVAAAGYDANATKRDPKAYKELPGCCR